MEKLQQVTDYLQVSVITPNVKQLPPPHKFGIKLALQSTFQEQFRLAVHLEDTYIQAWD